MLQVEGDRIRCTGYYPEINGYKEQQLFDTPLKARRFGESLCEDNGFIHARIYVRFFDETFNASDLDDCVDIEDIKL